MAVAVFSGGAVELEHARAGAFGRGLLGDEFFGEIEVEIGDEHWLILLGASTRPVATMGAFSMTLRGAREGKYRRGRGCTPDCVNDLFDSDTQSEERSDEAGWETGREVDRCVAGGPFDGGVDSRGERLLKQLTKAILERALAAELTSHLGYEKHGVEGRAAWRSASQWKATRRCWGCGRRPTRGRSSGYRCSPS